MVLNSQLHPFVPVQIVFKVHSFELQQTPLQLISPMLHISHSESLVH